MQNYYLPLKVFAAQKYALKLLVTCHSLKAPDGVALWHADGQTICHILINLTKCVLVN